uniref:Uncharacterized protein n=1 Tax=Rhipicephalus zambeziensis TaxID=60191 RepID=A0A224YHK3_9ACAR
MSPLRCSSSFSTSIFLASFRFSWSRRLSWHRTTMPVGVWQSITQLDSLLTACPPGPLPWMNCSTTSSSFKTGTLERSILWAHLVHSIVAAATVRGQCSRRLPASVSLPAAPTSPANIFSYQPLPFEECFSFVEVKLKFLWFRERFSRFELLSEPLEVVIFIRQL